MKSEAGNTSDVIAMKILGAVLVPFGLPHAYAQITRDGAGPRTAPPELG